MKRLKLVFLSSVLLLLAMPVGAALAAPDDGYGRPFEKIVTGGDYTLKEGEIESGDIVILGGSAEIEAGSTIQGNLIVLGGSAEIDGDIEGDVIILGGSVDISDSVYIGGDFAVIGGSASIDEGADIRGEVATNPDWNNFSFGGNRDEWDGPEIDIPDIPPRIPDMSTPPHTRTVYIEKPSFAGRVGSAFLSALGVAVVAFLIGLFLPKQTEQVRKVLVREPVMSGAVGFLTFMAAVFLTPILAVVSAILVLVCIGILGFPIIVLMWLAIGAASLFGWAAIGQLTGRWLRQRLNLQGLTPMSEIALGAFSLTLALGIVKAFPLLGFIGAIVQIFILCFALGAVILTRFGQRDYQRGQPILPERKPKPAAPAEVTIEEPVEKAADESEAKEDQETDSRFDEPELDEDGPFPEK